MVDRDQCADPFVEASQLAAAVTHRAAHLDASSGDDLVVSCACIAVDERRSTSSLPFVRATSSPTLAALIARVRGSLVIWASVAQLRGWTTSLPSTGDMQNVAHDCSLVPRRGAIRSVR